MATSNPSREAILARIRDGLRTPAPPIDDKTFYGPIFEAVENPLERFQQECKANLMEGQLTLDSAASAQALAAVLQSLPPGEIFVQDDPVLRRLMSAVDSQRQIRWSSEGGPREQSQATLTLADALIAQTGSIFVSASGGGRGASVVAPTHIVYAFTRQLVPDLITALRNATADGRLETNSYACVISGSSRTADIEKILVQGAHGPMRLVVIVQMNG
ncbi:MAG TPA: LUD domain-containing protein [Candidatus Angelobacter sp.]|jgi:L-lactate dehydrogenase complex protein LldG|nr:LUD domain-containing protein [Candidatus Angelobacter sp.]